MTTYCTGMTCGLTKALPETMLTYHQRRTVALRTIFNNCLWPYSLGSSDAIWRQRSVSTLAQVMACCLTAPSHYLNQFWLIISKVKWHSSKGKFTRDNSAINHWNFLENLVPKISFKFPRGQWTCVRGLHFSNHYHLFQYQWIKMILKDRLAIVNHLQKKYPRFPARSFPQLSKSQIPPSFSVSCHVLIFSVSVSHGFQCLRYNRKSRIRYPRQMPNVESNLKKKLASRIYIWFKFMVFLLDHTYCTGVLIVQ